MTPGATPVVPPPSTTVTVPLAPLLPSAGSGTVPSVSAVMRSTCVPAASSGGALNVTSTLSSPGTMTSPSASVTASSADRRQRDEGAGMWP